MESEITMARVHEDMDRDRYFTAEQARDYGLIDRVIASHELTRVPTGRRDARQADDGLSATTRPASRA